MTLKKQTLLEMWKTKKIISWLDGLFDTAFLAFIWIMGWNIFFWAYLSIAVLSTLGNRTKVNELEEKLK